MKYYRLIFSITFLSTLIVVSAVNAENWPRFRGPTGQGISSEKGLPAKWSATENVAWKTEIPGEGWSSPIVWGDHVFVTSTTDEGRSCHIIALDRSNGKILWSTKVLEQTPTKKRRENSYATPTPVTDGKMVYAVFSSGGFAAVDYNGKLAWTNRDYKFYSHHGLAASPILYEDLMIMPFDGSSDGENNRVGWKIPWEKAVLVALEKTSGKVRWEGKRGLSRLGHVTPNVFKSGEKVQIVSGSGDRVQGFDPKTGKRIWSIYSKGEGVTPSIVVGKDLIFSCSGFEEPTIRVVKSGGEGDITKSHIAWEQKKGVPSMASLLYIDPYIYSATIEGVITCFESKTGKLVSQKRIGGKYSASPISSEGRIYLIDEHTGLTTIITAGPDLKVLGKNELNEKVQASPAASQGQLFLRTEKNLYCIGK